MYIPTFNAASSWNCFHVAKASTLPIQVGKEKPFHKSTEICAKCAVNTEEISKSYVNDTVRIIVLQVIGK